MVFTLVLVIVLAIPLLYHCYRMRGAFNLLLYALIVSGVAIVVELIGVTSGGYTYTGQSLAMVAAFTGIGWLVNTSMAMHMAIYLLDGYREELRLPRIAAIGVLAATLGVIYDLFADPLFVALGVWVWARGGPWYGIPTLNFVGWFWIIFVQVFSYLTILRYAESRRAKVLASLLAILIGSATVVAVIRLGLTLGIR